MGMVATEAPVMISSHWLAIFRRELCQAQRNGVFFFTVQCDNRPQKGVPVPQKGEDAQGAERWGDQRQGNSGIHSKFAQSVNPGPHPKARWERR